MLISLEELGFAAGLQINELPIRLSMCRTRLKPDIRHEKHCLTANLAPAHRWRRSLPRRLDSIGEGGRVRFRRRPGTFANVDERKLPLLRCGRRAFVPGPSRHTCRDDSSSTTPTVPTGDARRGVYEGAPGHCATKYALPAPLLASPPYCSMQWSSNCSTRTNSLLNIHTHGLVGQERSHAGSADTVAVRPVNLGSKRLIVCGSCDIKRPMLLVQLRGYLRC